MAPSLILELLAETTYPVPEGHTGNISTLLVQVFATVFGYSFNVLTTQQINMSLTATGVGFYDFDHRDDHAVSATRCARKAAAAGTLAG